MRVDYTLWNTKHTVHKNDCRNKKKKKKPVFVFEVSGDGKLHLETYYY